MTAQPLALAITADPWGEPKDLEELHAPATRAILRAVADLKALAAPGAAALGRPRPLVVLGTAGSGKTHLFSRLRRNLGRGAIMVHIRPLMGTDMTPRYVLGEILQQLARPSGGARQIDSLVGATLAQGLDGGPEEAAAGLELLGSLDPQGRKAYLEHLCARLLERMPDLDDGYLETLLNAPFLDTFIMRATLAWLGGKDINESQAGRIGVHQPLAEDRVLPALRTVARLAAPSAPLVVVFDQLENLVQGEGRERVLAYGNLVMDLVDDVKDLVIVQMALDTEWHRRFRPALSLAQQARVLGPDFQLDLPSPLEAEQLVRLWMSEHPDPGGPFPWPFLADEIRGFAGRGATPRMLLQELQRRLEGAPVQDPGPRDSGESLLAQAWEEGLRRARAEIDDQDQLEQGASPEVLADGLIHLVRLAPGLGLVRSQGPEQLQVGTPGGELRVAFIHQTNPRSITTALGRLGSGPGPRLGIRERWRPLKPTWKVTLARREALLAQPEVRWHWLDRKDAERLLALDSLLKAAVSRDLSGPGGIPFEPEQVKAWIGQALDLQDWELVRTLNGAAGAADAEAPAAAAPRPAAGPLPPALVRPQASPALARLGQLRVASVDRLLRECRQAGQGPSRRELVADLRRAGAEVTWIGENIVCLEGDRP